MSDRHPTDAAGQPNSGQEFWHRHVGAHSRVTATKLSSSIVRSSVATFRIRAKDGSRYGPAALAWPPGAISFQGEQARVRAFPLPCRAARYGLIPTGYRGALAMALKTMSIGKLMDLREKVDATLASKVSEERRALPGRALPNPE